MLTHTSIVTSVIGSIASILGLIALSAPRLTASDIENVEADLIQDLADQAKAVRESQERLALSREELSRLEQERAEIELLVRQVSLQVFMEEQVKYISFEVEKRVRSDTVFDGLIRSYDEAKVRLNELNGQIISSGRAETISRILKEIQYRPALTRPRRMEIEFMGKTINIAPAVSIIEKGVRWYMAQLKRPFLLK